MFNEKHKIVRRVRAILLTDEKTIMFIKRVKPHKPPYWVAPGGGVEDGDDDLLTTLQRELHEELGAQAQVLCKAFVLEHEKAGKNLEEHFYICKLLDYDLSLRCGPEFDDPSRGQFLPHEVAIDANEITSIDIKTPQLSDWLLSNMDTLRHLA